MAIVFLFVILITLIVVKLVLEKYMSLIKNGMLGQIYPLDWF